jgi:hypothetical protein
MLEYVRGFAMSKLREAGESTTIARAHAAWFATVADDADDRYHHVSIIAWLREFGIEIENARAALTWALAAENGDDALLAARIAGGLRSIWTLNERRAECRRWTEAALARVDAHRHPKIVARLMRGLVASCDGRALVDAANRAIPHCERIGDRLGLMALHGNMAREYALEGAVAESLRSADRAFGLLNEQDAADARWHVQLLQLRCFIHVYAGDLEAARGDLSRKTTIEASLGEGPSLAQFYMEALLAFAEGNARQSAELLDACVEHAATNAIGRATPLCDLAAARLVAGEVEAAGFAARESLELARFDELGTAWRAISHLATVAALRGRPEPAARLDGFLCAWCAAQHRVRGPYESASRELLTASLREQLSAEAVIRLAKEGAAFPFGHAVDEAFGA